MSNLPYENKLDETYLPTFEERRGDIITEYKFTSRLEKLVRSNSIVTEKRELRKNSMRLERDNA